MRAQDWPATTLGRVVDFFAGGSLPEGQPYEGQDGGYLLMKVSDMNLPGNGTAILHSKEWSNSPGARSATCPAGAVVIPKRGGAIGTNKKRLVTRPAVLDPNLMAVRPHPDKVDLKFLYQWFLAFDLASIASGSSVPQLNKRDLAPLPFPLPPIEEQRRIAEVLDRADELRASRRQALAHLDDLIQAIFLDMFGAPATNARAHEVVRLADLTRIGTGSTPSRDSLGNYGGTIPWVKTAEVNGGRITDTEEKISEAGRASARCRIYPIGSILIALYGQGRTRGQCGVLGVEAATNQACAVLLPNNRYDTSFMFTQLKIAYERLRSLGRGGNQANLNLGLVGSFEVLLPPLAMQKEFARRAGSLENLRGQQRASLAELDGLFASLQDRAFRGLL